MDEKKLEMILLLISLSLDALYKVVNSFRSNAEVITLDDLAAMIARTKARTDTLLKEIDDLVKSE